VRGRLGYSGGVVAEAGASVNGEATGREAFGGERAGDGMGGTKVLTGGSGLPVGERRERERGGAADRWGRFVRCGAGARSWAAWVGEGEGERAGVAWLGPKSAQPRGGGFFFFSFFYFLFLFFHFLFLFIFISFSFESTIC
jgi:hypothetical protein